MTRHAAIAKLIPAAFDRPHATLRRLGVASALAVLLAGFAMRARADVPPLLPIQGYLTDKSGAALNGSKMVAFRLYASPTGGTPWHEETLQVVTTDGYFSAYLGDDSLHPLELAKLRDNAKVFLGIEVERDGEGVPRLQLASTAFAAQAAFCSDATNFAGRAPATFADAGHSHDWNAITGKPSEFPPSPHVHGDADISCYADLTAEGYLDDNSATDVLLRGQADSAFAPRAHVHDASEITSGVLADTHFSAIADLGAEGFLNNDAAGDLISQAQGDARFVNSGEPSSINNQMIVDGTILAADLANNSVQMDKTSAPLGAQTGSASLMLGTGFIMPGTVFTPDSNGVCVVTATARLSGAVSAAPAGYFYAYPAYAFNGGTATGMSGTPVSYGMPASVGTNTSFQTGTVSGQMAVIANNSYQFGCSIFISSGTTTFAGSSFQCNVTWICN